MDLQPSVVSAVKHVQTASSLSFTVLLAFKLISQQSKETKSRNGNFLTAVFIAENTTVHLLNSGFSLRPPGTSLSLVSCCKQCLRSPSGGEQLPQLLPQTVSGPPGPLRVCVCLRPADTNYRRNLYVRSTHLLMLVIHLIVLM